MGHAAEPSSKAKVILLVTDPSMPVGTATGSPESSGKFRISLKGRRSRGYEVIERVQQQGRRPPVPETKPAFKKKTPSKMIRCRYTETFGTSPRDDGAISSEGQTELTLEQHNGPNGRNGEGQNTSVPRVSTRQSRVSSRTTMCRRKALVCHDR